MDASNFAEDEGFETILRIVNPMLAAIADVDRPVYPILHIKLDLIRTLADLGSTAPSDKVPEFLEAIIDELDTTRTYAAHVGMDEEGRADIERIGDIARAMLSGPDDAPAPFGP